MSALKLGLAALVALSFTSACQSAPPPPRPQPALTFLQKPVMIAPVNQITFKDSYMAPMIAPNIEHNHDVQPEQVVETWVEKRVRATSAAKGQLTIEILDASIVQEPLAMDKSLSARVTKRQEETKLVGTLRWKLTYKGPVLEAWSSEGIASGSGTILEQASLHDQDQAYVDLVDALGANFDKRMEEQLVALKRAQSDAADASGH